MNNPLLSSFKTTFESAPFSEIQTKHFVPAIEQTITEALNEIDVICKNKSHPTFHNTLEALDNCGSLIGRNSS